MRQGIGLVSRFSSIAKRNMSVREATHAGRWYEGNKAKLSKELDHFLDAVATEHPEYPVANARVLVGP